MDKADQTSEDLKSVRGKRDHHNKNYHNSEDVKDLRKKANRRNKPRVRYDDVDSEEE